MHLIRGLNRWPKQTGTIATIGNFDGVHLGHQAIFKALTEAADHWSLPATVISFNPLPHEFFASEQPTPRLQGLRDKFNSISQAGVDNLLILTFDKTFSQLDPNVFIQRILVDKLGIRHLIVGDDFRFGYQRQGNFAMLEEAGSTFNFTVSQSPTVEIQDQRVSSTRIRKHLAAGELEQAKNLLGNDYRISGRVVQGEKIGRQLGFPTANVALGELRPPLRGVFAVWIIELETGRRLKGVANLGERPTLGGRKLLLEAHALDQNVNWYGKHIAVEFVSELRKEQRFDSLDTLKQQIIKDAEAARRLMQAR